MLEEDFGLVQLSTGDLLRAAVRRGPRREKAKAVMEAGGLVSDDIVLAILKDRMAAARCARGVILDGFPRTAGQAAALDGLLAEARPEGDRRDQPRGRRRGDGRPRLGPLHLRRLRRRLS
jgi:adenylate kinase